MPPIVCLTCPRELNGNDLPDNIGGIQPIAGLGQSRNHELIQMGIFNFILKILKGEGNLGVTPSYSFDSRRTTGGSGNGYDRVMGMSGVAPGASEDDVRRGLEADNFTPDSIDLLFASSTFRKMMNW